MKSGSIWVRRLSIFALLVNSIAVGVHYYLVHKFAAVSYINPGGVAGPISGIARSGDYFPATAWGNYACHVVRYTSVRCKWCLLDETSWRAFDETLRNHGCDSVVLAPFGADLPKDATSLPHQELLLVVPASLTQNFSFFATPTTVVLDGDWRTVWSNVGILHSGDAEKAVFALKSEHVPRP
jgi:hypothetical protein